jgi:hypothetical protein
VIDYQSMSICGEGVTARTTSPSSNGASPSLRRCHSAKSPRVPPPARATTSPAAVTRARPVHPQQPTQREGTGWLAGCRGLRPHRLAGRLLRAVAVYVPWALSNFTPAPCLRIDPISKL